MAAGPTYALRAPVGRQELATAARERLSGNPDLSRQRRDYLDSCANLGGRDLNPNYLDSRHSVGQAPPSVLFTPYQKFILT